jgi:hypothetical protein
MDNCYSGAMIDAVRKTKPKLPYAVFASSMANQESTQNWTFTEALINGFRGESFVDTNADGKVTFREVSKNFENDMLFGEEQMASSAFINGFDPDITVATAGPLRSPRIGQRVEALSEGEWYRGFISDVKGTKLKVHYYGFEVDEEEWLPASKIRIPPTGSAFKVGERVEVQYKRKWYSAHIINIKGRFHYVTYDDYDVDENEWVPSKRIRKVK